MHTKWKLFTKCHHQDLGTYSKLSRLLQDLKVVYVCISFSFAKKSLRHLLARVKTQIQMFLAGLDIHSTQLKIFNCNKPTDLKQQKMENSLCRWFKILRILYFQKIVRNEISKTHTLVGTHAFLKMRILYGIHTTYEDDWMNNIPFNIQVPRNILYVYYCFCL